jgi:NAD(P)-dependent dehydrogenase (short-subunit alcohol dehydrogenase family)
MAASFTACCSSCRATDSRALIVQDVNGLSVVITGGGSGLGRGAAIHLAGKGAKVTIGGRRRDKIEAVRAEIGASCRALVCDVTKHEDRQGLIDAAVEHGGGIDALINNAGNMVRGPITDLNARDVLGVFDSNVVAPMMLTGLAVPHLAKRGGAVVFIGSVHTRRSFPGASPYAATKGAVEVLARVLAAELGPRKIRVNCVIPGAVPTEINVRAGLFTEDEHRARMEALAPLHALGRIGTDVEIAEAIEYLITAEWTTGASLVVDGGLSLGISNL